MKKIIVTCIFLASLPVMVFAANPAPYTEKALQDIFKAIADSPRKESSIDISREEFHRQSVAYFANVFAKAGYSFNDTINKVIDDLKNNPDAIPRGKETVYSKVYMLLHLMMYQCQADKVDLLQFFPDETKKSIQWLMENSEFVKHAKNNPHHGFNLPTDKAKREKK